MRDSGSMTMNLNIEKCIVDNESFFADLFKPLPERNPYSEDGGQLTISTITGRVIGIPYDELSYFMKIYQLHQSPAIYVLNEELHNTGTVNEHSSIKEVIDKSVESGIFTIQEFVDFLEEEKLLPESGKGDLAMNHHLRQSLIKTFDTLKQNYPQGFAHPDFQHVLADIVYWSVTHLKNWLKQADIKETMPAAIWYGEASNSHLYFLYFLMLSGCDVLIFHPEGKDQFQEIDEDEEISFVHWYPAALSTQPLRKNELERLETVAYRSSKQLDVVLRHDDTQIYKPWQFQNHIPQAVTLKTTYDELFLIAKESAFIRPGFHAGKTKIEIPNIFAKINGSSANKRDYWNKLHMLMEFEQTNIIRHFPFSEEEDVDYTIHYMDTLDREGNIDPEKLKHSAVWLYKHLPQSRQTAIAHAVSRLCAKPKLLPLDHETLDDVRLYLFTQVTNIAEEGLRWIQTFDYAQTVPKLILYHTEKNGMLIRSDAAKLLLLNELGFDILVYHPAGYVSIEKFIDEKAFDIHMLDEMEFEQKFKRPSIFKKMFSQKK